MYVCMYAYTYAELEITVGHWPFSDRFQHLADQIPFWSAKFHFGWPNFSHIFNGTVINNLRIPVFKKG